MHSFYYTSEDNKKDSTALLVMGKSLMEAFSMTLDGTRQGSLNRSVSIGAPTDDYVLFAPHALLKNELFIFGGDSDNHKVRKLVIP